MELKEIRMKIKKIKKDILEIGSMRPGSMSEQYNVCGVEKCRCKDKKNPRKHGPYYNLNYVYLGKKKTQFIRDSFAKIITKECSQFKIFKELTLQWIGLEIERSNLEMNIKIEKNMKSKKSKNKSQ